MEDYSILSKILGMSESEVKKLDDKLKMKEMEKMCNDKAIQMLGVTGEEKRKLMRKLANSFPTVHNVLVGDVEHISDYLLEHEDVEVSKNPIAEIDHKYFVFERKVG